MSPRSFVPDDRFADAPKLPTGRPPTKAEVWAYVQHVYAGVKSHDELVTFAREMWAGRYILRRCIGGWDKQPDWTEGQPVIAEAVPAVGPGGLEAGSQAKNIRLIERCIEIARNHERRAA